MYVNKGFRGVGPHIMGFAQSSVVLNLGKPYFLGPSVDTAKVLRSAILILLIAKQRRHVDPQLHPSNKTHFSSERHS